MTQTHNMSSSLRRPSLVLPQGIVNMPLEQTRRTERSNGCSSLLWQPLLCTGSTLACLRQNWGRFETDTDREAGAQAPLYFVGGLVSFIGKDFNASKEQSWFSVWNTLAIALTIPSVERLQDLLCDRIITLVGSLLLVIGCVLTTTAFGFGQAVTGMILAGLGSGIGKVTRLAG